MPDSVWRIFPDKWNIVVAVGFTPDADTLLELSTGTGNDYACYGSRGMDGMQFRRNSLGLRFEKSHITPRLTTLRAQRYRNQADHMMDSFTLRTPPTIGMMAGGMASNVKRTMTGGRVAAILFDKTYSEHLNLAGNADFGYPGGTRINEPGRTLWLRADVKF